MRKISLLLAISGLCLGSASAESSTIYLNGTFNYDSGFSQFGQGSSIDVTIGLDSDYYYNTFLPNVNGFNVVWLPAESTNLKSITYTINNTGLLGMDGTYNVDLSYNNDGSTVFLADTLNVSLNDKIEFTFSDFSRDLQMEYYSYFSIPVPNSGYRILYRMTDSSVSVPESSNFGLIGVCALGIALAAKRRKKTV